MRISHGRLERLAGGCGDNFAGSANDIRPTFTRGEKGQTNLEFRRGHNSPRLKRRTDRRARRLLPLVFLGLATINAPLREVAADVDGNLLEALRMETHAAGQDDQRASFDQLIPVLANEPFRRLFGGKSLFYSGEQFTQNDKIVERIWVGVLHQISPLETSALPGLAGLAWCLKARVRFRGEIMRV
jgi:hypothetical protein